MNKSGEYPILHTSEIVKAINRADGCPHRTDAQPISDTPVEQLTAAEAKAEYYTLLSGMLPEIIDITRELRETFPHGILAYAEPGSTQIISGVNDQFHEEIEAAVAERGFGGASYVLHDRIAKSIHIAGEEWLRRKEHGDEAVVRLTDLTDEKRRTKFGYAGGQKRVSAAMAQTVHISASFENFIDKIYRAKNGEPASTNQMAQMYAASEVTAAKLTDLHLNRTRPLRDVMGAETFGDGIVERYTDSSYYDIVGGRLELNGATLIDRMKEMTIDTSNGRIGCPGKMFIPEIWKWIGGASKEFTWPILNR